MKMRRRWCWFSQLLESETKFFGKKNEHQVCNDDDDDDDDECESVGEFIQEEDDDDDGPKRKPEVSEDHHPENG